MRSKFLMRLVAVGASAAAVLGGGSFALAADSVAPAAGTVYSACVTALGHALYNVHANSTPHCFRGDSVTTWNQTGPQGLKGDKGDKGDTGAQGPAGPAGTFGSIHTFSQSTDLPNDIADTFNLACDSGSLISGGFDVGEPVIGVTVDTNRPAGSPPSEWDVTMSNTSGLDLTLTVDVVCVTPTAGSANAAARVQGAHVVKSVQTKLKPAKP